MAQTHEERKKALEAAEKKNIVEVAQSLGMDLVRNGRNYTWSEHDSFVFNTRKNLFYWNSRQRGGGAIQLVQIVKDCSYKEAVNYLNNIEIGTFDEVKQAKRRPFHYHLKEHSKMDATIDYLVKERKLSRETVDFFVEKGLIAQATYKDKESGKTEPVVVFKHFDFDGKVKGIALQGMWENHELHGDRGYLKRTWGDGYYGLTVRIGNPPTEATATKENPLTIIVFEAPIDLMSYYELNKETIGDAVLLCMNGLRKETVSKYVANYLGSAVSEEEKINVLTKLQQSTLKTDKIKFVFAVDNDQAGKRFVKGFGRGFGVMKKELPPLLLGKKKSDWNDHVKDKKSKQLITKGEKKYMEKRQAQSVEPTLEEQNVKQEKNVPQPKTFTVTNDYLAELKEALEETVNTMESTNDPTHYLTEEDVKKIMDEHFAKVEQLIEHFQTSHDLLKEPTKEEATQLKEGLIQTVESANSEVKRSLAEALAETKQVTVSNVKEKANQLRIYVKNAFNKPILALNNKIRTFVESIDRRFALETGEKKEAIISEEVTTISEDKKEEVLLNQDSALIKDVQEYITLNETNEALLSQIQQEIQVNPLAKIDLLQKELEENQKAIAAVESRIETTTPKMNEAATKEVKGETLNELSALVKEKERLEQERTQLVQQPEFLRQEGSLDTFKQVDQQLTTVNEQLTAIEKGTLKETEQTEVKEPTLNPFVATSAVAAKQVVEHKKVKNESLNTALSTQNTAAINTQLKSNMAEYYDPNNVKSYLDSASKFHNYSPKNVQLIMEQDPGATQIASEKKWEKLGYELREDAKPIQIYQPKFVPIQDEEGRVKYRENNQPETTVEFQLKPVYDVSQTTAGQLKAPITYDLSNKDQFMAVYQSVTNLSDATITFQPLGNLNGHYDAANHTVIINEGLGKEATIQTLLNEVIPLHNMENEILKNAASLNTFEQEATAYMVANHIGLDTSSFTFSSLSKLKEQGYTVEDFTKSLTDSAKNATEIISTMDKNYTKSKEVSSTKNKFEERKIQAEVKNKVVAEQYQKQEQSVEQAHSLRR
ncbi:toprim domain-containing protein [Enterococcus ureasiticus]|uniref:toprim domain-containing protein n=1 Tax=Enterococcus ureasiticus TaxID=903984 RepID=UPI001A8DAED6|nr:toprim domain-containing protein [Enterococcus ureasiticus]